MTSKPSLQNHTSGQIEGLYQTHSFFSIGREVQGFGPKPKRCLGLADWQPILFRFCCINFFNLISLTILDQFTKCLPFWTRTNLSHMSAGSKLLVQVARVPMVCTLNIGTCLTYSIKNFVGHNLINVFFNIRGSPSPPKKNGNAKIGPKRCL